MAELWMDREKTPEERAEILLAQMTLEEKAGQAAQRLHGFGIYHNEGGKITLTDEFFAEVEKCRGLGFLYGFYRADPWSGVNFSNGLTGKDAVTAYNMVQKYVMDHSRLHIPVMMSSECPHGHQALDGYLLPVNLCSASSFDPELLKQAEKVCAAQLKSQGVHIGLVSMLDILRDPRWGRSEETFGEDPYLASVMAGAAGDGFAEAGLFMEAKHFAAQGETTGGVNASAARIGERELREIHLPAALAAVRHGAKGVMAAYNEIDGVFCHMNRKLLTDILRGEFGFDGIVMSDGTAIDVLNRITGDPAQSAASAMNAGVDVGLWDEAFGHLVEAVEKGYLSEERLNEAVRRILTLKFAAGIFDRPFIEENEEAYDYVTFPQSKLLASESVILLKNEGNVLPLGDMNGKKIAVIGPDADDIYRQLGDYVPEMKKGVGSTVREGIRSVFGASQVSYAVGSGLRSAGEEQLAEAQQLAGESDVTVLVLGSSSSRFEETVYLDNGAADLTSRVVMDCGEGLDTADVTLPGAQLSLLERVNAAVRAKGGKLITVIIAGRPMAVTKADELSDALLYAFYPGPCGGEAIAEILKGITDPSGRLPASLPRTGTQLPVYYNYRSSYAAMRYVDERKGPLYSFGYGLDYTEYAYSGFAIGKEEGKPGAEISFCVTNTGSREGTAVTLIYLHDRLSSVVTRVKQLKGFARTPLRPGESAHVSIALKEEAFAVVGPDMKWTVEPGEFDVTAESKGQQVFSGVIRI